MNYLNIKTKKNQYSLLLIGCFFLFLTGCTSNLISRYDENTDIAVTELHKDFTMFFLTLKNQDNTPDCDYKNHKNFYIDSSVALSSIDVRANAIDKNEKTIEQIQLLKNSIDTLIQLHRLSCLSGGQVTSLQSNFDSMFTAILKLELAKKRD